MSREQKNSMYYYLMKGYHGHLLTLCDSIISKKGKDPIPMFWKAFALGASGNINEALRQLDNFQARKDLHYPVAMAQLYFHQRAPVADNEAIDMLMSEVSAAEDVSKEPGFVLAARFALYTNDLSNARKIAQKVFGSSSNFPSSVFEHDALAVTAWCNTFEYLARMKDTNSAYTKSLKDRLLGLDGIVRNRMDQVEVDMLMVYVKAKQLLESHQDALNTLNQMIAMHPWYTFALTEKATMLASMNEWDQALDTAQRALDIEKDNIDAMKIITVHAFTQECQPDDATQKLLDLDKALTSKEPYNAAIAISFVKLFSSICARQPRVLDICIRALERAVKNVDTPEQEGEALCSIGAVRILQGPNQYPAALKAYKEAVKRDGGSIHALEGMVKCQLLDGQYDDAEAQLELLLVMHSIEEMSYEYYYLKACLAKELRKDLKEHFNNLELCKKALLQSLAEEGSIIYTPFAEIQAMNPDFALLLAIEYFSQVQTSVVIPFSTTPATEEEDVNNSNGSSGNNNGSTMINTGATMMMTMNNNMTQRNPMATNLNNAATTMMMMTTTRIGGMGGSSNKPSKAMASSAMDEDINSASATAESSPALQSCIAILNKLLRYVPGHVSVYVELARCLSAQGLYEDASRQLRQCLSLQPKSCPALIALAKVEISRQKTPAANRTLEQALAADFSIRSSVLFQLIQVYVKAQQGKYDECILQMEKLMKTPEILGNMSMSTSMSNDQNRSSSTSTSTSMTMAMVDSLGHSYGQSSSSSTQPYVPLLPTDPLRLTNDDRAGAFITYSYLLSKTKRLKEAKQVLAEAKVVFAGTDQEVQVLVASSQLAVERKDFDSAIRMLDKISEDSNAYTRAQIMKADILLTYHRDKEGYTQCYHFLVEKDPSAKNYAALGEAYLRILNPEAAVDALERAYRIDPIVNSRLRSRIGRALIATHEYHRAIDFYENSIKEIMKSVSTAGSISSEAISLSHDLAKLYCKLGRFESSTRVLNQILHNRTQNIAEMRYDVTTMLLLSEVQFAARESSGTTKLSDTGDGPKSGGNNGNSSSNSSNTMPTYSVAEYVSTLTHAKDIQKEIVNMLRSSSSTSSEVLEDEKEIMSDICDRIGLAHANNDENGKAIAAYKEAIQYYSSNTNAILGQAKFYRLKGDMDTCKSECQKVIHIDPSNSEAAIILSEILFITSSVANSENDSTNNNSNSNNNRFSDKSAKDSSDIPMLGESSPKASINIGNVLLQKDFNENLIAVKPLQDLLKLQPNNYYALEKIIKLLRRAGKLLDIPTYFEDAIKNDRRATEHAGYHYCQGLYARYINDIGKAIAEFNLARRDDRWGSDALTHMIELYLNPDQEGIWEERSEEIITGDVDEQITNNLNAAETLLKELESKAKNPLKYKVLENYYLMATRQKSQISRAVASFKSIYDKDPDYLPGVLGLATANMMEKDEHKAHNLLKRVTKMDLSEEDGEDFDKANLLLAKSYVDKSKYNLAQEICQRCLSHNRSSAQAWEILGLIYEKSSDYDHAAECYEKAWKLEFEASAAIGFKLAFCYLKCGRFVDCIDVCENVLQQYPDYPRIREEILKKAHQDIRTNAK